MDIIQLPLNQNQKQKIVNQFIFNDILININSLFDLSQQSDSAQSIQKTNQILPLLQMATNNIIQTVQIDRFNECLNVGLIQQQYKSKSSTQLFTQNLTYNAKILFEQSDFSQIFPSNFSHLLKIKNQDTLSQKTDNIFALQWVEDLKTEIQKKKQNQFDELVNKIQQYANQINQICSDQDNYMTNSTQDLNQSACDSISNNNNNFDKININYQQTDNIQNNSPSNQQLNNENLNPNMQEINQLKDNLMEKDFRANQMETPEIKIEQKDELPIMVLQYNFDQKNAKTYLQQVTMNQLFIKYFYFDLENASFNIIQSQKIFPNQVNIQISGNQMENCMKMLEQKTTLLQNFLQSEFQSQESEIQFQCKIKDKFQLQQQFNLRIKSQIFRQNQLKSKQYLQYQDIFILEPISNIQNNQGQPSKNNNKSKCIDNNNNQEQQVEKQLVNSNQQIKVTSLKKKKQLQKLQDRFIKKYLASQQQKNEALQKKVKMPNCQKQEQNLVEQNVQNEAFSKAQSEDNQHDDQVSTHSSQQEQLSSDKYEVCYRSIDKDFDKYYQGIDIVFNQQQTKQFDNDKNKQQYFKMFSIDSKLSKQDLKQKLKSQRQSFKHNMKETMKTVQNEDIQNKNIFKEMKIPYFDHPILPQNQNQLIKMEMEEFDVGKLMAMNRDLNIFNNYPNINQINMISSMNNLNYMNNFKDQTLNAILPHFDNMTNKDNNDSSFVDKSSKLQQFDLKQETNNFNQDQSTLQFQSLPNHQNQNSSQALGAKKEFC